MRKLFYQAAPLILVITGLIIWGAARLLDVYTNFHGGLVWAVYLLVQMIVSLYCGFLIQKLHRGAYIDVLTGLYNRRYFHEKLAAEIERVKRTKNHLSLALIDIDEFKGVNDHYGHLAGDKVLQQLAGILQQNTRAIDTVARWGGEEFIIILPETGPQGAKVFAERLRNIIAISRICNNVTVSVGIASANEEISIDKFIALADQALYKAKEQKNIVVSMSNI